VTPELLRAVMPHAVPSRCVAFAPHLARAMSAWRIETPRRQAAFLAQCAHESGSLLYTREIASGEDYEGRQDLGNIHAGDGRKFPGRGLLQVTGRFNYRRYGEAVGKDFLLQPQLLELPEYAADSAGWFWHDKRLNQFADRDEFAALTKALNGGYTHLDRRISCWLTARAALAVT
jgi:putative chitinase